MPGKKIAYRLYSDDGLALIDLMQRPEEKPPEAGKRVLCRHPFQVLMRRNSFLQICVLKSVSYYTHCPCLSKFQESKRAWVVPSKVEPLYTCWWENGKVTIDIPPLEKVRENVQLSLQSLRPDHTRPLNPTPYKVFYFINLFMQVVRNNAESNYHIS